MTRTQQQVGPALLLRAGLIILGLSTALVTPADADLWGHLTFGRDILSTGQIVHGDVYSFTSDRPWVNHEWLSEIGFAAAYQAGGSIGLITLKLAIVAAVLVCIWMRWKDVDRPRGGLAILFTIAFVGTYWRTHTVRPQLFSVLLFSVLLLCLTRADAGKRRALLIVPIAMSLWANLHGGWIMGLGVLGLWCAVRVFDSRTPKELRAWLVVTGVASVAATFVNPYGWRLWEFLSETVRLERSDIEDWVPIYAHPLALGLPWAMSALAAGIAMWRSGQRPRLAVSLVLVLLLAFSFRVSRVDAFLALAVAILLAPEVTSAFASLAPSPVSAPPGVLIITGIAAIAMLVPAVEVGGPYIRCLSIDGGWTPDASAGRFIAGNQLSGRMLTWFDWGEYAIWHFGPRLQVSLDGRRETVYSDNTLKAHRRFYAADATANEYLRALNPDYIWLPVTLPVSSALERQGWVPIFRSDRSAVWSRSANSEWRSFAAPSASQRCFPGP